MKLELGFIEIKDIQFSNESKVENGTLFVNADDVKAFVYEDDDVKACVKSVCFDIAKPGESVRITPVKDVIEPRVKVEGPGGEFPGVIAKVDTVGSGKTHVLRGMAVVTAGPIVGFQEGIIDMTGPGAEYTPFSKLLNLVMVCTQVEGVHQHEYEHAVRIAGLRAATFIGELGRNVTPDETKEFETLGIREGLEKYPNLPRVGYVHMLQSQGLLHDTYVYGVDAKRTLTTIIYPTETMDGAIISGNCVSACDKNTTYHHQNNPVVADLFEQHGKTLNYVCNIITNENVYLADKQRSELPDVQAAALQAAIDAEDADTAAEIARAIRNRLLKDSDAEVALDRLGLQVPSGATFTAWLSFLRTLGEALVGGWAEYRQLLRDLPQQEGWPLAIQWPTAPGSEEEGEQLHEQP